MIPLRIVSFFKFTPIQVYMTRYKRQISPETFITAQPRPQRFSLKKWVGRIIPSYKCSENSRSQIIFRKLTLGPCLDHVLPCK